jgi:hypothetical protein
VGEKPIAGAREPSMRRQRVCPSRRSGQHRIASRLQRFDVPAERPEVLRNVVGQGRRQLLKGDASAAHLLDLRRRDADVERPLEVAAKVVVPAEHGERRDRQHAPRLEVEPRPRVHAAEHQLVGEPQEVVRKIPVGDRAFLPCPEEAALHFEAVLVRLLAHLILHLPCPLRRQGPVSGPESVTGRSAHPSGASFIVET